MSKTAAASAGIANDRKPPPSPRYNVTYGEAISGLQPDGYRKRLWEDLYRVVPPVSDVRVQYVLGEGRPGEEILKLARKSDCDLVVLGSHGRTGFQRLLMGSVAEEVIRKAPCPVLVVKAGMAPRPARPRVPANLDSSFLTEGTLDS